MLGETMTHIPKGALKNTLTTQMQGLPKNYFVVEDLSQTPCAKSSLEVLQSCPSQRKALLAALGSSETCNPGTIMLDMTNLKPCLPQPDIINVGVGLYPPLMGTFDYPPSTDNVHYMPVVLGQPRAKIFQILSFRRTYFNNPWTLPSPSAMMEGTGHHGMVMPLLMIEVTYYIVQQAFADSDQNPTQDLDMILKSIWAQGSLTDIDYLDFVLPSNKAIIEVMNSPNRPWDDLHH
jgi:hypothetical protein